MIKIKLINSTDADLLELASHAALICYQSEAPKLGEKKIDVQGRLFEAGHHTTLQHSFFTFEIEDIAVGDITFGMHLTSPFYNSDQRSGRYCAKMFVEPDFQKIERYIRDFWSSVSDDQIAAVIEYVKKGVDVYQKHIADAAETAKKFIKEERPYINEKALEMNAPKIAQEQMRMFISVIFPTAFDFTVNTTALVAMWESAWSPVMKYVTDKMKEAVVEKYPDADFLFNEARRRKDEWSIDINKIISARGSFGVLYRPEVELKNICEENEYVVPDGSLTHPVDKLHFTPEMMDNSVSEIKTRIKISTVTMGQDQRHRTIRRSIPIFTGYFYLPPICRELKLGTDALALMKEWSGLCKILPGTLATVLAPYGAMVAYTKSSSYNAIAHEQGKRLCWCAQEEIYHQGRELRRKIENLKGKDNPLLRIFEPPCFRDGKCAEGQRYCGRDIRKRETGDYFPERKV